MIDVNWGRRRCLPVARVWSEEESVALILRTDAAPEQVTNVRNDLSGEQLIVMAMYGVVEW